jgi:hypothetical protein
VPEPKYTAPLLPELDVPVLNTNKPVMPLTPAFDVCSTTEPLLVTVLKPLTILINPPVDTDDKPPTIDIAPPILDREEPVDSNNSPPEPL